MRSRCLVYGRDGRLFQNADASAIGAAQTSIDAIPATRPVVHPSILCDEPELAQQQKV
jgi:hypothetical protein